MPRGGRRAGAGRPQGSRNKSTAAETATLSELAKEYSADALRSLHRVAVFGKREAAIVSASVAILDRAYGKPAQLEMNWGEEKEDRLAELMAEITRRGSTAPIRPERSAVDDVEP